MRPVRKIFDILENREKGKEILIHFTLTDFLHLSGWDYLKFCYSLMLNP